MSKKIKFIIFIVAVAFCIVFSGNIYSSVQSYKYRRLCDKYREQLIAATEAMRLSLLEDGVDSSKRST